MYLWNWFATRAFHTPEISFLHVLGISLVISLFSSGANKFVQEERKWDVLMTTLQYCVPEDKKEALAAKVKEVYGDEVTATWGVVILELGNALAALSFGFVIHVLG